MAEPLSDYGFALAAIRQSDLKHPDGPLLESFIDDCFDRDRATAFLRMRLSREDKTPELNLRTFLAEWKRTIAICRMPIQRAFIYPMGCQADWGASCS
jgi:hypothetical protein